MHQPQELSLDQLNAWPADAAKQALASCCTSERWISEVLGGRPYESVDSLLAGSDAAVTAMTETDLRQALAGHPRIGERRMAGWSSQEQAGVSGADAALMDALADGNAAYEEHFGHIYLACATGRSGPELLALLRERLGHDPASEWRVVASELARINQLRLRKLIGDAA